MHCSVRAVASSHLPRQRSCQRAPANWQMDACLPTAIYNKSSVCELKPLAKYTVNASEPRHVSDALKFASKHNLRVSVKNTGLDYLGRSTSSEFSIWTHCLQGITIHSAFQARDYSKCSAVPTMTVGAGNQFAQNLYRGREPQCACGWWC